MDDKCKCFDSDDLRVCEVRVCDLPTACVDTLCRCNDLLIVRYGLDALKITEKKADPSVFT